eukprot:TRINITY_DN2134_c0_g1_i3.p1 TRINITY_DN2134_c0_g1~~TRINITY_DN2134_c0_g1_i3.p1  ORF type:complete len:549 (+),score=87.34 TRINITY_DN2134_c0_g1_i3:55-1701(+)
MKRRKVEAASEPRPHTELLSTDPSTAPMWSIDAVLAEEMIEEILKYLPLPDLASLCQCSSQWLHRIDSNILLWKWMVARYFKVSPAAIAASPRVAPQPGTNTTSHTDENNIWKWVTRLVVQQQSAGIPNLSDSAINASASSNHIVSHCIHPGVITVHAHYTGSNQSNHAARTTLPLVTDIPPHRDDQSEKSSSPSSWVTLEASSPFSSSDDPNPAAALFTVVERSVRYFEVRLGCRALTEEESELLQPLSSSANASSRSVFRTIKKNRRKARKAAHPLNIFEEECVAIGAAPDRFPATRQMPGWKYGSIGYHSDDGALFIHGVTHRRDLPQFGAGDVIGVGVYPHFHNCLFYTLNGRFLCVAAVNVNTRLYPTVGLDSDDEILLNFGGAPFVFDVDSIDPLWDRKAENLLRFEGKQGYIYEPLGPAGPQQALLRRFHLEVLANDINGSNSSIEDDEDEKEHMYDLSDDNVEEDDDEEDGDEDEEDAPSDHLPHHLLNPRLARALIAHRQYQSDGEISTGRDDQSHADDDGPHDDDPYSSDHGGDPHSI